MAQKKLSQQEIAQVDKQPGRRATIKSARRNPRREKPKYAVEVWGGTLFVKFDFRSRNKAEDFFMAALESESVTSCVMFIDGKFNGARDGAGS